MSRSLVWIWGLWDWGAAGFSVLAWTFVFGPYLTGPVGAGLSGGMSPSSWLGLGVGASGLALLIVAPGVGPWIGAGRRRGRILALCSAVLVVVLFAMSAVRPDPSWFWFGLALLSFGLLVYELATVPYNAMLRDLAGVREAGDVSGLGMAMGYAGGIFLLGLCYSGLMAGAGERRGFLQVPAADGWPVRLSLLFGGAWLLVFTLPLVLSAPRRGERDTAEGFFAAYRTLGRDLRELWRIDSRIVQYLLVSAIFRDGLVGFATFGAVVAASVYGFEPGHLLLFGVASNGVAAVGAMLGGRLDGRYGPKRVIVLSLAAILVLGVGLLVSTGAAAFWVFGIAISIFIGPVLASARTMLLQLTPPGKEGEMFGLYAVSGRTVAFLSPLMFGFWAHLFHADRAGAAGIIAILALGLAGMMLVEA